MRVVDVYISLINFEVSATVLIGIKYTAVINLYYYLLLFNRTSFSIQLFNIRNIIVRIVDREVAVIFDSEDYRAS